MPEAGRMDTGVLEERSSAPTARPQWPFVVAIVVGVLVIAVIGVFVANETSSIGTSTTRQVAAIRQACDQWGTNERTNAASECSAMAEWMGQQVAEGHVTARMMWGDAGAMAGSCVDWADASSVDSINGTTPAAWCDRMTSWMEGHVGNWGSWMMQGGMMGGP